ncbi:MAG: LuxR C-terminal-related transcriptional regulator [Saccharospirillaceae bacterium]|nr:LuxR C-terminal-related transcriptional regulator [Saccharospirillaceae bacterium]
MTPKIIKASVMILVAGPGFGKTTVLQKAIASWNMRDDHAQAIVHCTEKDSYPLLEKQIAGQLRSAGERNAERPEAIFINNAHLLAVDDESRLLNTLLGRMRAGDELWLASRRMPAVSFVRWHYSHSITVKQEADLMSATDGCWPAIHMMKGNSWHQGALDSQVRQYLQQEFLQTLNEEDIELLAQLSLFEEINSYLWRKLNLTRADLFDVWQKYRFLYPPEEQSDRYVWIPEVRKVLQQYPVAPDQKKRLLEKACDYWLRHGCFQLLIDSFYDDSESYLSDEKIIIPLVIALIFTRRFYQARFVLEQMEELPSNRRIQNIIDVLSMTLALFTTNEGDQADKLMTLDNSFSGNNVIVCLGKLLAAYRAFYQSDLNDAANQARDALFYMNEHQQVYLSSLTEMLLIACDKYRGYTIQAAQQLVLGFNNKRPNPEDPGWQNYAAGMLIFYYEKNDLIQARLMCEQVIPYMNNACSTEVIVHFYLYYSRILELFDEQEESFEYLIRLQRFLSLGNYPRYQGKMVAERMRQAVRKNDRKSMNYLRDKFDIDDTLTHKSHNMLLDVRDYLSQAKAMQLMFDQQYDAVIALLIPLRDSLLKSDFHERALVAEAQIVVAYWLKGEQRVAADQLAEAINFYGWLLFNRGLLDEAPGVVPVMLHLIESRRVKPTSVYLKLFESLLNQPDPTCAGVNVQKFESLTTKEQQVMASLADGLSNQNIARHLKVAPATVKWHLKNIYRKLELENRSSAIAFMHKVQPVA